MIELSSEQPFARGGNRLCYKNPVNPDRCIKVRRPDFNLKDLRRKKGFPKTLLPLNFFDDNEEEFKVINKLHKQHGKAVFQLISRCYGFTETDLGQGLELELIRDDSGQISQTLKAQIWLV